MPYGTFIVKKKIFFSKSANNVYQIQAEVKLTASPHGSFKPFGSQKVGDSIYAEPIFEMQG